MIYNQNPAKENNIATISSVTTPFQNITNEMEKHGVLMDESLYRIELILDRIQYDSPGAKLQDPAIKGVSPNTFVEVVFNRLEHYNSLLQRVQTIENRLAKIV